MTPPVSVASRMPFLRATVAAISLSWPVPSTTTLARMFSDYDLGQDVQRVYVQTLAEDWGPVYHYSADFIVLEYHVLDRIAVEDAGSGVYGVI